MSVGEGLFGEAAGVGTGKGAQGKGGEGKVGAAGLGHLLVVGSTSCRAGACVHGGKKEKESEQHLCLRYQMLKINLSPYGS